MAKFKADNAGAVPLLREAAAQGLADAGPSLERLAVFQAFFTKAPAKIQCFFPKPFTVSGRLTFDFHNIIAEQQQQERAAGKLVKNGMFFQGQNREGPAEPSGDGIERAQRSRPETE